MSELSTEEFYDFLRDLRREVPGKIEVSPPRDELLDGVLYRPMSPSCSGRRLGRLLDRAHSPGADFSEPQHAIVRLAVEVHLEIRRSFVGTRCCSTRCMFVTLARRPTTD
jgi:hypothetical protein